MRSTEAPLSLISPEAIGLMLSAARSTPPGAFVEVGVYRGGSAWHLAKLAAEQGRLCVLCDTFEGIPLQGPRDKHKVGDFADTSLEAVRAAIPFPAVFVPGVFPWSMRSWETQDGIAFVHLDCDQEETHRLALAWAWPRLVEGGVVWCDDAHFLPAAGLAVHEFANARGIRIFQAIESGLPTKHFMVKGEDGCLPSQ